MKNLEPVSFKKVVVTDAFWTPLMDTNRSATIPAIYKHLKRNGQIDAMKLDWKEGKPNKPYLYWDGDVAKWIEAAAYSIAAAPDKELEKKVDYLINLFAKGQQEDGYLNSYYTTVEPQNRFTGLRTQHEDFCAMHLIEAGIAYYEVTGKRKFLNVVCRYADCIDSVFGPQKGKKPGYPGHGGLELALVKLYRLTGRKRYLKLATFFINERGKKPNYFELEAKRRGDNVEQVRVELDMYQAHLPVREQKTAEGQAVRATYLFSSMADIAAETKDSSLLVACRRLWKNIVQKRMYITGGTGSYRFGERFTFDYDLPNETGYAETCAAIGLVLFAHRMLRMEADSQYADVMERVLYNGLVSGVSQDGRKFFYGNPLAVLPETIRYRCAVEPLDRISPVRLPWIRCACCPTNIIRILGSIGQYIYSQTRNETYISLYVGGTVKLIMGGKPVELVQRTGYPWKEAVRILVKPDEPHQFTLALRIPGWCSGAKVHVNGKPVNLAPITEKGYAKIRRLWKKGDAIDLTLPMPVERLHAHPSIRMDCGRVALQRGPIVYCFEEIDNGKDLNDIELSRSAGFKVVSNKRILRGVPLIIAQGRRRDVSEWKNVLYRKPGRKMKKVRIQAVPYYLWNNRTDGEMLVWIREG